MVDDQWQHHPVNATTIEVLRAESTKLKRQAKKIDELISEFEGEHVSTTLGASPTRTPQAKVGSLLGDLVGAKAADACYMVLGEAKSPLSRLELFDGANARGASIASIDNLSSILSRDPRFASVGKGRAAKWTVKAAQ